MSTADKDTPLPAQKLPNQDLASASVLVVEDDTNLAYVLCDVLEGAGIKAVQALTLSEARKHVTRRPDLIILDWSLPDGEGVDLIKTVRADVRLANIPVLMLTGRSQVKEKITGLHLGADDYMTKPFHEEELLARVTALLRRAMRDLEANPLTGLPGNLRIETEAEKWLAQTTPFDAVYFDIDHFKPYNDRYGFARGDEAISLMAECLLEEAPPGVFVGHVGGDDFVALLPVGEGETFASKVAASFAKKGRGLHDKADQLRGYYESKDRQGNPQNFALLSATAAIISTSVRHIQRYAELAQAAAEIKSAARKQGLHVLSERRLE